MTIKETFTKIMTMLAPYTEEVKEVEEEVVVTLEKLKLEDGITVIEADSFEAGKSIFILTDSGESIPMPIGTYKLEDGRVLEVIQEGIIDSVADAPADAPVSASTETEPVDAAPADAPAADAPAEDVVTREEFDSLVAMVEEMKTALNLSKETLLSKETEIEELKVALSTEPAAEKINHTPTEVKKELNNNNNEAKKSKFASILSNINN